MADVYGRLTGRAGVCLATLGPGATNLVTGVADANMDRAPLVAISGQAATTRMHKESHQALDLVNLFAPISKFHTQIVHPETIPEVVRKAFKQAETGEAGGGIHRLSRGRGADAGRGSAVAGAAADPVGAAAAEAAASGGHYFPRPLPADHGRQRRDPRRASKQLLHFAEKLHIPVASTFMAKGVVPFSHCVWLGAVGMR